MKYKVTVKWIEEYELEIEADDEQSAYDQAVEESTNQSASDCYLHDVDVQEIEDDGEDEDD